MSNLNHSTITTPLPTISNASNTYQMTTKSKNSIFKPQLFVTISVPTSGIKALQQLSWHAIMKDEFQALQRIKN